ncbi:DUF6924 domain-containing protein [Streptomyces sp. NPDC048258]|uniref:DUF6924 domain-containing protein n=1 Tax=Streptomyces sp. NPDC048258 TaxID=3365527 RepID=UPI00371C30B5
MPRNSARQPAVWVPSATRWAGSTPAQVLTAMSGDQELSVASLADRASMHDRPVTLLAMTGLTRFAKWNARSRLSR